MADKLGFRDILSAIPGLAKGIALDPFLGESNEELTFTKGAAQGLGNIAALTASAPFAISELLPHVPEVLDSSPMSVAQDLYNETLDKITSNIVSPVKKAFGKDVTPEQIREDLQEQRRKRKLEQIEETRLPKGTAASIRGNIERAVAKETGFKGLEDIVKDTEKVDLPFFGEVDLPSEVNIPGALGLGLGTLAGGAALSAVPIIGGAGIESGLQGSIASQLARLGITEGSKRAIAAQIGTMGVGNAIAGSPLTIAAAQKENGQLDSKELATGLALDALFGAGFSAAGIGALKAGGKATESIQDLSRHLRKRTSKISQDLPVKQQARQQIQAEEALARAQPPEPEISQIETSVSKPPELDIEQVEYKPEISEPGTSKPIEVTDSEVLDLVQDPQTLKARPEGIETLNKEVNTKVEQGAEILNNIEDLDPAYVSLGEQRGPLKTKIKEDKMFDSLVQPLVSRVSKISPEVAGDLRRFEMKSMLRNHEYKQRSLPFLEQMKKVLTPDDKRSLKLALYNRENQAAKEILSKYSGVKGAENIIENFDEVSNVLGDLYTQAKRAGMDVGHLENYFPRRVKDYKKFLQAIGSEDISPIRKAWREEAQKLGKTVGDLSTEEKALVANKVLMGQKRGGLGFTKSRKIDQILEAESLSLPGEKESFKLVDLYSDPEDSLLKYIDSMSQEIEKRKFLGKGEDISSSIGARVAEMVDDGRISPEDEGRLQKLLRARFVEANRPVGPLQNRIRNLTYAATIGNPLSTITQLSDLSLSAYKNGLFETLGTIVSPKKIKIEDLGLEDIAAELMDPGKTGKFLDKILSTTQFKNLDKFGKETHINSAYKQMRNLVRKGKGKKFERFIEEHKPIFGEQLDDFVDALKRGDVEDENVKLALFNRLSEVQPISLSEMPEAYLNSPSGRVYYMLKTFTLKQLDLIRKDIISQIPSKPVTATKNLIKLATLFGGAQMGVNQMKDFILGREVKAEDAAIDSLLQTLGLSKYTIYKARDEGPGRAMVDMLIPPTVTLMNDAALDIKDVMTGKMSPHEIRTMKNVPVVGKPVYWWIGGGRSKEEKRKEKASKSVTYKDSRIQKRFDQIQKRRKEIKKQLEKRMKKIKRRR